MDGGGGGKGGFFLSSFLFQNRNFEQPYFIREKKSTMVYMYIYVCGMYL